MEYSISAFKPEVQKIINSDKKYFDPDNSGTINQKEMVNLLFSTNIKDERELLTDGLSYSEKKKDDYIGSGLTGVMSAVFASSTYIFSKIVGGKNGKIFAGILGLCSALSAGLTAYLIGREPTETPIRATRFIREPEPPKDLAKDAVKLIQGLNLPAQTPMIEYIPQKGEYWTSILKAKYGVDETTAQKMAWKIKQVIYDDPKAPKQSPIIYLPKVWDFGGKRYEYIENSKPKTTSEFSNEIKTDMGKMKKDIKY